MADKVEAEQALRDLLWELPAEFSIDDITIERDEFRVIGKSNVRHCKQALLTLQEYFGLK